MNLDEAFAKAPEVGTRVRDSGDRGARRHQQIMSLHSHQPIVVADEPDYVTIFIPVPGREGEFTSKTLSRRESVDDIEYDGLGG